MTTAGKTPENPILARLTRRTRRRRWWPLAAAGVLCAGAWCSVFNAQANVLASLTAFAALVGGIVVPLATLFLLASLSANLPVDYMHSVEFELVSATPLSSADWVRGFNGAVFRRSQVAIWLAAGLLPLVQLIGTAGWSPSDWVDLANLPALVLSLVQIGLWEVALLGLYAWVVSIGVSCALWWRYAAPATLTALIVPLILGLVAIRAGQLLTEGLAGPAQVWVEAAWTLILATAPFPLARLTQRWGERWAPGAPRAK